MLLNTSVTETAFSFGFFQFFNFTPHNSLVFCNNQLGDTVTGIDYHIAFRKVYQNDTDFTCVICISIILPYRLFIL